MKAKLILANFIASWIGLSVDPEYSPLWACAIGTAWFFASCTLFLRASRRGDFKDMEKQYKINDL